VVYPLATRKLRIYPRTHLSRLQRRSQALPELQGRLEVDRLYILSGRLLVQRLQQVLDHQLTRKDQKMVEEDTAPDLLPGAPNMAPAPTPKELRTARRQGKADARTAPDSDGHHPTTLSYSAEVDRVEALIHAALIAEVARLDERISRMEAELRVTGSNPPSDLPHPPTHDLADGSADARNARRDHATAQAAANGTQRAHRRKFEELSTEVASTIARRYFVHERAASILQTWQARFSTLASAHRAGFIHRLSRRWPRPRLVLADLSPLPEPRHRASHPWAGGEQFPITVTTALPSENPSLAWSRLP
jgi:hypothetical protein